MTRQNDDKFLIFKLILKGRIQVFISRISFSHIRLERHVCAWKYFRLATVKGGIGRTKTGDRKSINDLDENSVFLVH